MKKIIFAMIVLSVALSLSAQEVTSTRTPSTLLTVPADIKANFATAYPDVVVISWEPFRTYWRASYKLENRVIYVFYDERGVNYRASLPVLQNNVSEDVVNKALTVYGPIVYGITRMKGANDTEVYQVRLLDNGTTKIVWMNADGTAAADVFKMKTDEVVVSPVKM